LNALDTTKRECFHTIPLPIEKIEIVTLKLKYDLWEHFYRYDLFQAMRLLECAYPNKIRFGEGKHPEREPPIRFGQAIALTFETTTITSFEQPDGKVYAKPLLKQRAFGLFGTNGPMPIHLTDYVYQRSRKGDKTWEAFANLFHHRMLSLFYRAWANNEPTVSFDRPKEDRFSDYVGSLSGLGGDVFKNRDAMPDLTKYHYTAALAGVKSAENLRAMLSDYFGLTVIIEQFVGEWLTIDRTDLTRLQWRVGNNQLGRSAVLGRQVWGCQHKFRVYFAALTWEQYQSVLPTGKRLEQLTAIIRNFSGDALSWDVHLVLKKEEVPQTRLGQHSQLGWSAWLGKRQSQTDAQDLILNPFWGI
jgi:type VI secretion system protein ImpH